MAKFNPQDERLSPGFRAAIKVFPRSNCWAWQGGLDRHKNAATHQAGKRVRAALVAYITLVGPVPEHARLSMACNARNCVNPAHARLTNMDGTPVADLGAKLVCTHCGSDKHTIGQCPWRDD